MNTDERHILFRQIIWDYDITSADVKTVVTGQAEKSGT